MMKTRISYSEALKIVESSNLQITYEPMVKYPNGCEGYDLIDVYTAAERLKIAGEIQESFWNSREYRKRKK